MIDDKYMRSCTQLTSGSRKNLPKLLDSMLLFMMVLILYATATPGPASGGCQPVECANSQPPLPSAHQCISQHCHKPLPVSYLSPAGLVARFGTYHRLASCDHGLSIAHSPLHGSSIYHPRTPLTHHIAQVSSQVAELQRYWQSRSRVSRTGSHHFIWGRCKAVLPSLKRMPPYRLDQRPFQRVPRSFLQA